MRITVKSLICMLIIMVLLLSASIGTAGNAVKGKIKSAVYAARHGQNGISVAQIYLNLMGQKEQHLASAITAYKNGRRSNAMMVPMVASLSEEDTQNLAAYYANLACE